MAKFSYLQKNHFAHFTVYRNHKNPNNCTGKRLFGSRGRARNARYFERLSAFIDATMARALRRHIYTFSSEPALLCAQISRIIPHWFE